MAKVHPDEAVCKLTSSKQQVFTLWMKSLIMSSNGCAVFDSKGRIVYRVDNYSNKCIKQVYVMDAAGKVVFTIVKKKLCVFGMWEGERSRDKEKTRFGVRKLMGMRSILGFVRGYSFYKVVIRVNDKTSCEYTMENQTCKMLCCRIVDHLGGLVAEVKRKTTKSGVVLGEDVLTMVVEPHIDHSLIIALALVLGLIHHKL